MGGDGGGGPTAVSCWCNGADVILALNKLFGEPADVAGSIFADEQALTLRALKNAFNLAVGQGGTCDGKTLVYIYGNAPTLAELTPGNWGTYLQGLTVAQATAIAKARLDALNAGIPVMTSVHPPKPDQVSPLPHYRPAVASGDCAAIISPYPSSAASGPGNAPGDGDG